MHPELLLIVLVGAFLAIVLTAIYRRSLERLARLRVLEQALASQHLDETLRRDVASALRAQAESVSARFRLPQLALLIGWFGLFLGAGICAVGPRYAAPSRETVGISIILAAVALLTLPIAFREFEKRRTA